MSINSRYSPYSLIYYLWFSANFTLESIDPIWPSCQYHDIIRLDPTRAPNIWINSNSSVGPLHSEYRLFRVMEESGTGLDTWETLQAQYVLGPGEILRRA